MKKLIALVLGLCLIFSLVACTQPSNNGTTKAPETTKSAEPAGDTKTTDGTPTTNTKWTAEKPLKVAYATSTDRGDNGSSDAVWNSMQEYMADKDWIDFNFIETGKDYNLYETQFLEVLDAGVDIFICSANYSMADIVGPHCAEYPDTTFWFIDLSSDFKFPAENCAGMLFLQNEGMFMTGALAANISKTGIISFVGGTESTVIMDFGVGYWAGATYENPDIKIIYSFVGDFNDSAKGKELALAQAAAGSDVIHNVAGTAGLGALEGAAEAGIWAIGVDNDQNLQFTLNGKPEVAEHIYTSMIKCWDNAVVYFVDRYINDYDSIKWGEVEAWGFANGGVEFVRNDYYYSLVSKELDEHLTDLEQKIISGEIEVPTAMGMPVEEWEQIKASVALKTN